MCQLCGVYTNFRGKYLPVGWATWKDLKYCDKELQINVRDIA